MIGLMSHAVKTAATRGEPLRATPVAEGRYRFGETGNIYYQCVEAVNMAVMHYVCADCGNAVQEIKMMLTEIWGPDMANRIGEYCDDCNNWNPEVVIAYR